VTRSPPKTLPQLDATIHAPIRLQVMAALSLLAEDADGHDFTTLKGLTNATDGNLGAHLTSLENAGYIAIRKSFQSKRPRTTAMITEAGRAAYESHVAALKAIISGKRS
jgi:DNA-binding MarR family transcriptional regulator